MNEKTIWDFLLAKTGNAYGTAAIIGNLMAESSLNPACATGKNKTANYVADADAGNVNFVTDNVAFGLAQWCVSTRKAKLWNYVKNERASVGDLNEQLGFLWKELSEDFPKTCEMMKNATSIREASDQFMVRYEKPGDQSENMKKRRANYGQKFYDQFAEKPQPEPTPQPSGKKMVKAKDQVNLRSGAGKGNARVGELRKGQELEYIATENGWHKVAVWVMDDFVEVVQR